MKIGIMGGTFDPIHYGHLSLAKYAVELFHLDEVWFMPNGNPPHKNHGQIESQTKHRVEMVKLAIQKEKHFLLELYEVERKETNYSYLTMEHFQKKYPYHQFYFLIGADSLFTLDKWKCPDRLLKTCTVLAAYRDDTKECEMREKIKYLNQKYNADIRLLNMPDIDISSTEIRERLKLRESIQDLVPETVFNYIQKHELFKDEL